MGLLQSPRGSRNGTWLIYDVEQRGSETEGGQNWWEERVEGPDSCEVVGRACDVEHLN